MKATSFAAVFSALFLLVSPHLAHAQKAKTVDFSRLVIVGDSLSAGFQNFSLLDTQFLTEHLAQFGAVDIPRQDYKRRLRKALEHEADFYRFPAYADGDAALQAIAAAATALK